MFMIFQLFSCLFSCFLALKDADFQEIKGDEVPPVIEIPQVLGMGNLGFGSFVCPAPGHAW